jgi:hypothetical protein
VALTYTGATTAATVNAMTAAKLTSNTVMGSRLAQTINSEQIALIGQNSALTGAAVSQSIPCDTGSITISGNTNNTGAGTLAVDYVDCKLGFDTLNGPATLRIDAYDAANKIITDSTLTFTRVHFTGATGLDTDITGTQRTRVTSTAASWCSASSCATETMTQNIIFLVREGNTSRTMRSRLTLTNQYQSATAPTFFTQSLAGNVDDDQLGTVSVGTATAPFTGPWGDLYYSTRFQPYPDWGIVNIDGAANSRARASSMGIALAKVEVDADGDSTFENNARLPWTLLVRQGGNLNDSDGDGMHDSWEVAMGLDPTRDDRNQDNDGDGYSNLTEYLAGADASTSGSIPGDVRHLWVTNLSGIAYDDVTDPAHPAFNVFTGSGGNGVQLNTVTRELGPTTFSGLTVPPAGSLTVTDAQGRTFTLSPTATPSTWILSSSTGTSITIDNVGGSNPTSLIRYGDRGIAFRTVGAASPGSSAFGGYIYLVESRTLIP